MHAEAYMAVRRMIQLAGINREEPWQAIDVGGAYWNGSARPELPKARWTILELEPPEVGGGKEDWDQYVVGDATIWRPEDSGFKKFDVVLCTELLEHVELWPDVVKTLAACVTEHGSVFITCASTSRPVHGSTGAPSPAEGEWYGNVDVPDLELELRKHFGFVWIDYAYPPGDAYALARFPL